MIKQSMEVTEFGIAAAKVGTLGKPRKDTEEDVARTYECLLDRYIFGNPVVWVKRRGEYHLLVQPAIKLQVLDSRLENTHIGRFTMTERRKQRS